MKCILHIGTEKTGTTLIQEWLYANEVALSEQGVFLSQTLGAPNNRLLPAYCTQKLDHWARKKGLADSAAKDAFFQGLAARFAEEIAQASQNHSAIIISSEHLHSRTTTREEIERVREVLAGLFDEVRVICYFRDQASMAVSLYSTVLRRSSTETLDEFLRDHVKTDRYYYDFLAIADNWSEVFGRQNCEFRLYDRDAFHDGDIRADFLAATGLALDVGSFDLSKTASNASLSPLQCAIYRRINEIQPYWDPAANAIDIRNLDMKERVLLAEGLRLGALYSHEVRRIREQFADPNRAFLQRYFPKGVVFNDQSHTDPEASIIDMQVVEEVVADLATTLLVQTPRRIDRSSNPLPRRLENIAVTVRNQERLGMRDAYDLLRALALVRPGAGLIKALVRRISSFRRDR